MVSRSHRVLQRLEEWLPLARGLMDRAGKDAQDSGAHLMNAIYECLEHGDQELFQGFLEALRAEGLSEVWQFIWDQAVGFACEKSYTDESRSVLVGQPLLAPWTGRCTAQDRKQITKLLKEQQVLPKRSAVSWAAAPQSAHFLRDVSPVTLWDFNTPGSPAPHWWTYRKEFTPGLQILVGRVELPPGADIEWMDLEDLRNAMASALDWAPQSLGYLAPLLKFLELDEEETLDPLDQMLTNMGFSIRHALQHWLAEVAVPAEECTVLLDAHAPDRLEVYVQAKGKLKAPLCRVEYGAPTLERERILDRVRVVLSDLGVRVLWVVDSGRNGPTWGVH